MKALIDLQITMFLLIFIGWFMRKAGIIGPEGKKVMTDLVINLILPCNIIRSFMIQFSWKIAADFAGILIISLLIQVFCLILGKILYRHTEEKRRQCLSYGIICSNAGFLGNPVAEGVFGSMGLALASIYLIPQRIMMWSEGIMIFTEAPSKKELARKVLTHPCIVSIWIGLALMVSGWQLPVFLLSPLTALSNCNNACSMLVIGMILSEAKLKELIDPDLVTYSLLRLILIPLAVYIPCRLLVADPLVGGVSVLLAAMPAGATTSILASKYRGDEIFAVKLVVFSTLASLISTPVWSFVLR